MDRESKIKKFLQAIRQIESSGGKNIEHKPVKSGPLKGQIAQGDYGLMPTTAEELMQQSLPKDALLEKQDEIARKLAEKLFNKTGDNVEQSAAGWLYGHNLSPERLQQKVDSDYVKKVIDEYNKSNEVPAVEVKPPRTEMLQFKKLKKTLGLP